MTELQATQLKILEDTCAHFNSSNRSTTEIQQSCLYSGVGCAIGRLIEDKELCKRLDSGITVNVDSDAVFNQLPSNLQELGRDFLTDMQQLHDYEANWNDTGLSLLGQITKDRIIRRFELR